MSFFGVLSLTTELYRDSQIPDGKWFTVMTILDELEAKNNSFWIELLNKWIVSASKVEIIMVPDEKLAKKMSETNQLKVAETVQKLGVLRVVLLALTLLYRTNWSK